MANYLKIFNNLNDFDAYIASEPQLPMSHIKDSIEMKFQQHRWVVGSGYMCSGTTKMTREVCQVSYDDGDTWEDMVPVKERAALPVIEYDSADCGWSPQCNGLLTCIYYYDELKETEPVPIQLYNCAQSEEEEEYQFNNLNEERSLERGVQTNEESSGGTTLLRASKSKKATKAGAGDDYPFYGVDLFDSIVIDGVEAPIASIDANGGYVDLMPNEGHTVVFTLKDKTKIGDSMFMQMPQLVDVVIPTCVTEIGYMAFAGCQILYNVTLPDTLESIGDYCFEGCEELEEINIPDSITHIGEDAFEGCNLSTTVENGVIYLDKMAVEVQDNSLMSYTLRNDTKILGNNLFNGCNNLSGVTIPSSVVSILDYTFYECTSLTNITIPDSVKSIGTYCFSSSSLREIIIPSGITVISMGAFDNCSSLSSVTIPNSVTMIGANCFQGCTSLTSITIPNSVTRVDGSAFAGCTSFSVTNNIRYADTFAIEVVNKNQQATLKNDTKFIGNECFRYCTGAWVQSLVIPDSVLNIGFCSFNGTDVTFNTVPSGVTHIEDYAFAECENITSFTLPNSVVEMYAGVFNNDVNLASVTISNSIESIPEWCFKGCETLTSITIPNSVTRVDGSAFSMCFALSSITFGNNITNIGDNAFYANESLTSISLPNSLEYIGASAFTECTNLTAVTLGNSVKTIGFEAFKNCESLSSINIPSSVVSIDYYAFNGCPLDQTSCNAVLAINPEASDC